jgi:hypothetical protein
MVPLSAISSSVGDKQVVSGSSVATAVAAGLGSLVLACCQMANGGGEVRPSFLILICERHSKGHTVSASQCLIWRN